MLSRNSIYSDQAGEGPEMADREQTKSRAKAPRQPDEGPELAFDPIAAALRQLHDTIASEEIPDDFLDLLDQLDDQSDFDRSSAV